MPDQDDTATAHEGGTATHSASPVAETAPTDESKLLREQLRGINLLLRVANTLHRTLDLDEICRILLTAATAGSALGYNRAILLLLDAERRSLVGRAGVGPLSGEEARHIWSQIRDEVSFEHLAARAAQRPAESELSRRVSAIRVPFDQTASVLAEAIALGRAITLGEGQHEDRVPQELRELLDTTNIVVVPLPGTRGHLGVLVADNRFSGRRIADEDVQLLESLTRHAGLAVERALEHARVARRLEERQRLHEISKGILATVELDRELGLIVEVSARLMEAAWSRLWLLDEHGGVEVAATCGHSSALPRALSYRTERIAAEAATSATAVVRHTVDEEPRGSLLCVPLVALDEPVGALAVFSQSPPGRTGCAGGGEDELELLQLLADQAAIAIQNAQLFERVRRTEGKLREVEAIRARFEKLAAIGELSAQVAHEIRTPLAAMGGFARRLAPHFSEGSQERKAVDIIVDESARLERLLGEQLEFARLSRPRPRPAQLEEIVEEVVDLVVEEARCRGVELVRDFEAALPTLLLDADQIKQVLLNLVQNGLESLAGGGRLRLSTRHLDSHVAVEVATDGAPIPDTMLDQLFVPFATSKRGGSGLGLAIARQIVREHGGQIRARSDSEWGAIFTVILPVRHL